MKEINDDALIDIFALQNIAVIRKIIDPLTDFMLRTEENKKLILKICDDIESISKGDELARYLQQNSPFLKSTNLVMQLTHLSMTLLNIASKNLTEDDHASKITSKALSELGRSGGLNSGPSRRRKAEIKWGAKALELARESRGLNSNGSIDFVATYISENWPSDKKKSLPKHARLKQVISIWIKEKKLPEKCR